MINENENEIRSFRKSWFKGFLWLFYNEDNDRLFCYICRTHPDIAEIVSSVVKKLGWNVDSALPKSLSPSNILLDKELQFVEKEEKNQTFISY